MEWTSVTAKIERLQRDFLWSGVGEGKTDHLVSQDVVCNPKAKGGLGFGKIFIRNFALLGKWLWRYPREGSSLWHQVILSIYGSHSNGWDANTIVRWSHRCPWKSPRSFPSLLGLWQEMGKEFASGKTCGGGTNLWESNIQYYLEQSRIRIFLFLQFSTLLVPSLGTLTFVITFPILRQKIQKVSCGLLIVCIYHLRFQI